MGSDNLFDIVIVNANPDDAQDAWDGMWEKEHLDRYLDDDGCQESFLEILTWCKINLPANHDFHKDIDDVFLALRQEMFPL